MTSTPSREHYEQSPCCVAAMLPDWQRHLRAKKKAADTIATYSGVLLEFTSWLHATGRGCDYQDIKRADVEQYLVDLGDRPNRRTGAPISPAHVAKHYRHLRQYWRWLHEIEEEIPVSPMARMSPPTVPDKDVPIISDAYLSALLDTCKGSSFEQRRDTAILRGWLDTGVRAGGLHKLGLADLNFDLDVMAVVLKGGNVINVPFGNKTGEAFRRYLRVRSRHPHANSPQLWLGVKGPLTQWGLTHILNRRTVDAGLPHLHPHQFRHTFAHNWLLHGGSETDLMRIMGWKSRSMIERYARSAAQERARVAHHRAALGDRV